MQSSNLGRSIFDDLAKALNNGVSGQDLMKAITVATGLTAIDLEPAAKTMVPALTPMRNMVPRVRNTRGGTSAQFKVILKLNPTLVRPGVSEGSRANQVSTVVANRSLPFASIGLGDSVTFQAEWAGRNFEDVKARAVERLLKAVMIEEEKVMVGGRGSAALATPSTPTVTSASTGGSIAAGTYSVSATALTMYGYNNALNSFPSGSTPPTGTPALGVGETVASTAASTGALTGSTNVISASVASVETAFGYAWYVNGKLEAITTINSVSLTSLYGTGGAAPAADTSQDSLVYDGAVSQLVVANNSYSKAEATGTAGVGTALSLSDIDAMFQSIWMTGRGNPDVVFVNVQESIRITNQVLASSGAPTLFIAQDADGRDKGMITGGYRVSHYINKATGRPVPIVTHPYMPQGTLFALSLELPFPVADLTNPIEFEARQEYLQLDYPVSQPTRNFDVIVDGALKLYFTTGGGVIRNIAPSA
jgi:hypothetical protein